VYSIRLRSICDQSQAYKHSHYLDSYRKVQTFKTPVMTIMIPANHIP
jgi:hypothetical protein